ncbi:Vesicle-mediated ER to Golgi transport protein [Cichlidogyrus casuarinus]|uniref:Vesicle-mediated ER to Golgi transport protein n=1 Tax=Cichlidogyrus casuarinus TaxID=1844966 RepID=A0ABD2Q2J1_9PLAT
MGLLQLLCVWLCHFPKAVAKLIEPEESNRNKESFGINLSLLIAEAASVDADHTECTVRGLVALLIGICVCYLPKSDEARKERLLQELEQRVGLDAIIERINQISRTEAFALATRAPQPRASHAQELIFDYEFTILFRTMEYEVAQALQKDKKPGNEDVIASMQNELETMRLEKVKLEIANKDLLVLVSDLDQKCKFYKNNLRSLNQPVSDDSDADVDIPSNPIPQLSKPALAVSPQLSVPQVSVAPNRQQFQNLPPQQYQYAATLPQLYDQTQCEPTYLLTP